MPAKDYAYHQILKADIGFLALYITLVISYNSTKRPNVMTSREQYDRLIATYIRAHEEGNEDAIGRLFTENAMLLPPGRLPLQGRRNIQEMYKNEFMGDGVKLIITVKEFQDCGGMLYGAGTFETAEGTGSFLDIIQRQADSTFLYHVIIWNDH